jgi:hypothetical protein
MSKRNGTRFPLDALAQALRVQGFELSVTQVLQLQALLLSERTHASPLRLKYLVAPLVATNSDEQERVYHLVDAYVAARTRKPPEMGTQAPVDRRRRFRLRLLLLLIVVATGAGLMIYNSYQKKAGILAEKPPADLSPSGPYDTFPKVNPPKTSQFPSEPVGPQFRHRVVYKQPIVARPIDYNLQVSVFLGIIVGAIIFIIVFDVGRTAFSREERRDPRRAPDSGKPALPDGAPEGEQLPVDALEPLPLEFPSVSDSIVRPAGLPRIKAWLRRSVALSAPRLDVRASIRETTRRAGFATIAYAQKSTERRYVVLVDRSFPEAPFHLLSDVLLNYLQAARVPLSIYYYYKDPGELRDSAGAAHRLTQLDASERYGIIIGDAAGWQEGSSHMKALSAFAGAALITPAPMSDWGEAEKTIIQAGYLLAPADAEAIELLAQALAGALAWSPDALERYLRKPYSVKKHRLDTVAGLRAYLDDESLFQVLCATALYPRLNRELMIALYLALETEVHGRAPVITYATLLRLARIPWLHRGELDTSLRMALLGAIEPETERVARKRILTLLDEVRRQNPAAFASGEFQVQQRVNALILYAHDPVTFGHYRESEHLFPDNWTELAGWIDREGLGAQETKLLPADRQGQGQQLEEFILREKEFQVRVVTLAKVASLLLPTFILYIVFFVLRPQAIYPSDMYNKVGYRLVLRVDAHCRRLAPTALVTAPGRQKPVPLGALSASDTFALSVADFREGVTLTINPEGAPPYYIPFFVTDSIVTVSVNCR